MKNVMLKMLVVVVLVVCVGDVWGADVYTTGSSGAGTIHAYVSLAGINSCDQTARKTFTFEGLPSGDVWAIVISDIEGVGKVFNGYGYSPGSSGIYFRFRTFGGISNPLVRASQIIFILNDDDPELFWIEGGQLIVGLGDDVVLGQWCVSINGKASGDISDIRYDYYNDNTDLNSVELFSSRFGPYSMNHLADFASFWLSGCDEGNLHCEDYDFNRDGIVNFVDFVQLSSNWVSSVPVGMESMSVELSVIDSIVIEEGRI